MLNNLREQEISFLSGLFTNFKKVLILLEKVKPVYFEDQDCKDIYVQILKLHKEGYEPDLMKLQSKVKNQNLLLEVGSGFVSKEQTEFCAKSLFEGYSRRYLVLKANNILRLSERPESTLEGLIRLDNEKPSHYLDDTVKDMSEIMGETIKNFDLILSGKKKRLITGSCFIDQKTDGLEEGSLNIIGARAGNGKTSFVIDLLHNFTGKAMFYSLEMNEWEIGRKFVSRNSGIDVTALKTKHCLQIREKDIIKSSSELTKKKLWIDCTPGKKTTEVLSQCRYLKEKHGLDLIVIDYLQIMKSGEKTESKIIEIGRISQDLKEIAKTLDIPIIALSQLGRAVESRTDKRPMISDIRWAGEIEENAHKIMFLHIPAKYDDKEDPNKTEVLLLKNRSGEADVREDLYVYRDTSTHRFYNNDDSLNWQRNSFD